MIGNTCGGQNGIIRGETANLLSLACHADKCKKSIQKLPLESLFQALKGVLSLYTPMQYMQFVDAFIQIDQQTKHCQIRP